MNDEELQAQLDWHYRAGPGLERLRRRLRSETRPRLRMLPFVRRLAAVAALVLVTFGLFQGLAPLQEPGPAFDLAGTLASAERGLPSRAQADILPGHALEHVHKSLQFAPGDQSPEEVRERMRALLPRLARGPQVGLSLGVTNRGKEPVTLRIGDETTRLDLDLRGPGVFSLVGRELAGEGVPPFLLEMSVKLAPGETFYLPLPYLVGGRRGRLEGVYWDRPGIYTLKAVYRVPVEDELGRRRDLYVQPAPISLDIKAP